MYVCGLCLRPFLTVMCKKGEGEKGMSQVTGHNLAWKLEYQALRFCGFLERHNRLYFLVTH